MSGAQGTERDTTGGYLAGSVLALFIDHHLKIGGYLAQVAEAEGRERELAFESLRELLAAHEAAEDVVLRPVTEKIAPLGVSSARTAEEERLATLIGELEGFDGRSKEFSEAFSRFEELLGAHLGFEEVEEFPIVLEELSPAEQELMGDWIRRAFEADPTGPRPGTAGSVTAPLTVEPYTTLLERACACMERTRPEL